LIDFIAQVKDDRILKAAAAAAHNFRVKVGVQANFHALCLISRVLFLANTSDWCFIVLEY
jgi:hypothetical protein